MAWLKPLQIAWMISGVIAVSGFSAMWLNQNMTVTRWQIDAPEQIKKPIAAYFAQKDRLDFWHTRAAVIQDELAAAIPDIQRIEVNRVLPDGLWIKATARKPVALWENMRARPDEKVMLVDEQGVAYRPIARGEQVDLPLLRLSAKHLKTAVAVLRDLSDAAPDRVQALSEVIVERQAWRLNFSHGEQWQFSHAGLRDDLFKVIHVLSQPRWARKHWRMDARIPERWFVRPARQEVI